MNTIYELKIIEEYQATTTSQIKRAEIFNRLYNEMRLIYLQLLQGEFKTQFNKQSNVTLKTVTKHPSLHINNKDIDGLVYDLDPEGKSTYHKLYITIRKRDVYDKTSLTDI